MNLRRVLETAGVTDVGRLRDHNEDCIGIDADLGLAVLADGMGGYSAGEVASGIAVATLMTGLTAALGRKQSQRASCNACDPVGVTLLRDGIARANASILLAAAGQPQYSGMGTTLVSALFHDDRVVVGHVGDSRLYRLRDDAFEQITRDHSLLQEQIDRGLLTLEQARRSQNRNLVTRALGIDPGVAAEINVHNVLPGDVYMLCSDGLSDMLGEEEIRHVLVTMLDKLQLAADRLVCLANDRGGRDNISVILVRVLQPFPASAGFFAKLKSWIK